MAKEPTKTTTEDPKPITQADIEAAVAAEGQRLAAEHASALAAAIEAEKNKSTEIKDRLAQYEKDKLAAEQNAALSELAEMLSGAPEEKRKAIMNAIEAGDSQSLLIQAREQATQPLIAERDEGFATRDATISELSSKLEQYELTVPCQSALAKHCGGLDNEIMADMALQQIKKLFVKNAEGAWVPDMNGPTKGMHPTEAKPLDYDGAAEWLAATIPAFAKTSTTSPNTGDGEKTKTTGPKGSFSERLKNATSEEEKEVIRQEMREARKAA